MEVTGNSKPRREKFSFEFKSLGVKVSVIISLILLLVLGLKGVYDGVTSYKSAIADAKALETEQTRKLANDLEKLSQELIKPHEH